MDDFKALGGSLTPDLQTLSDSYDEMLRRLKRPQSRRALKAAFGASSSDLSRMAVANPRRRG